MKKRRIPLWAVVSLVICCLCLLCWDGLLRLNGVGRVLQCQRILTRIGLAFQTYNQMPETQSAPNLRALVPYMRDVPSPTTWVPMCVGNRHGDGGYEWPYVYRSDPNSKDIHPICWDSRLHRITGYVFPDICRRNVLFSDGHVETMSERKFLKLMQQYSIEEPNKFQPTDTRGGRSD